MIILLTAITKLAFLTQIISPIPAAVTKVIHFEAFQVAVFPMVIATTSLFIFIW